ncbi:MAG: type II secretion system F family protein [Candidatus Zixiibacteriota bacterium]|jgi:MSHA biogenesis protein MshG
MPEQFKYRAITDDGEVRRGVISALDTEHVEEFLDEQQLRPIRIKRVSRRRPLSLFGFFNSAHYENLIMFTNSLATLHRAGVPLLRALSVIKVGPADSRFNRAIDQIRLSVQSGRSLSEAMAEYEDLFTKVYIASVAAGEESGKLESILNELADVLEKEMELNRQVRVATRYPMIVLGVIAIAVGVLMTFVVPSFVNFYSSFGAELPLPTKILIAVSTAVTRYWPVVLTALVALGLVFHKVTSTEQGRLAIDRRLLKLPAFGEIILKGNVARFALLFRILFNAGIPIVRTLDILSQVVKNSAISAEIRKLAALFQTGAVITLARGDFVFFPDLALNMLAIGMESGAVDKMMQEVGSHYSREVFYRSRQLASVIEPMLTIVLGVFVLIIALAIFLPMWSLIQVFKGG